MKRCKNEYHQGEKPREEEKINNDNNREEELGFINDYLDKVMQELSDMTKEKEKKESIEIQEGVAKNSTGITQSLDKIKISSLTLSQKRKREDVDERENQSSKTKHLITEYFENNTDNKTTNNIEPKQNEILNNKSSATIQLQITFKTIQMTMTKRNQHK